MKAMKTTFKELMKKALLPILGVATLGIVSCGNSSNPDAVTVDKLKFPGGLSIKDLGNGSVKLIWSGSNTEEDFDGYNVYGMKEQSAGYFTGLEEGESLKLLDDKGEPIEAAKTFLEKFAYDPEKKLESPGVAATGKDAKDKEFNFLPMHTQNAAKDAALLPTCKPAAGTGTKECKATTEANAGQTAEDDSDIELNGLAFYTVTGLTPGAKYCFLILSSMKEGKTVSQTSSDFRCVVPRLLASVKATVGAASASNQMFEMRDYLTAFTSTTPPTYTTYIKESVARATMQADETAAEPLYMENYSTSDTSVFFVAGKNCGVADLGYKENGLQDDSLPVKAPKMTYDTDLVQNGGGYSLPGQSVKLYAKHVYVIAVGGKDETAPTNFYYHWIYIDETTDPVAGTEFDMAVMLSKNADQQ